MKKDDPIRREEQLSSSLRKKLENAHWVASVSPEEVRQTQSKYEASKARLKVLRRR